MEERRIHSTTHHLYKRGGAEAERSFADRTIERE
jgi:hypothetical protein